MGFSFFGLFGQTNKFKTVDVKEFDKFIADTTVTLLDVRTAAEHAEGFIPAQGDAGALSHQRALRSCRAAALRKSRSA